MNEIVQTWFPVISAAVTGAVLWGLFIVRSTAQQQVDAAVADLRKEFNEQIAAVTKSVDGKFTALVGDIKELDGKVDKQDRRLIQAEEALKLIGTIGHNIESITTRLGDMREQMAGMAVRMSGLSKEVADGQNRTESALRVMDETLRGRP